MASVACSYNSGNTRHSSVAKVTESKAIISACGELYKGGKMVQIITSDIEWNNVYVTNASGGGTSSSQQDTGNNSKKRRNQDLLSYETRCQKNKRPARTNQKSQIVIVEEEVSTTNRLPPEEEMITVEGQGGNDGS